MSLSLHVSAVAFLLSATVLPQAAPVIEVFQADPFDRPPSFFDEGSPRRAWVEPSTSVHPHAAVTPTPAAPGTVSRRGDVPLSPPAPAIARTEVTAPPPAVVAPVVDLPPAPPPLRDPAPATPVARAPEPLPAPVERLALRPEVITPAAPPPLAEPRLPDRLAVTPPPFPASLAAPSTPTASARPAESPAMPIAASPVPPAPAPPVAAREIDHAGELPIAPPERAQPARERPPSAHHEVASTATPQRAVEPALVRLAGPPAPLPRTPIAATEAGHSGEPRIAPLERPQPTPELPASARADTAGPPPRAESAPALRIATAPPLARDPVRAGIGNTPVPSAPQRPAVTPTPAATLTPVETAVPVGTTAAGSSAATGDRAAPAAGAVAAPAPSSVGLEQLRAQLAGPALPARALPGLVANGSGMVAPLPPTESGSGGTASGVSPASVSARVGATSGTGRAGAGAGEARAAQADDMLHPQSAPKRGLTGITISAPADGHRLGPEEAPVVIVQGEVEDPSAKVVSLVVNDRRVQVPIADRRFRYVVPVLEPAVRLRAEGTTGDPPGQSRTITVHGAPSAAPALVLVLDGPQSSAAAVEVVASWRASAARVDVPTYPVQLKSVTPSPAMPSAVFYARGLRDGVYTLALRSGVGGSGGPADGTLYVSRDGQLSVRSLEALNSARRVLARLLMPFRVLWDQDDWFTGQSQSAEAVTKFRFPDGVTWIERKVDLAR